MTAAPLRLPLQALQRAVAQVAQAPLQLASWSLGWTFALQLASWLPLPLLLQVAVQLIGLTVAVAGLLALSERSLDPWQFSWRGFLTPLKRAPLPLLLLPLLMGSLIALLMRVGAAEAFSRSLAARASDSRTALLYTWLCYR